MQGNPIIAAALFLLVLTPVLVAQDRGIEFLSGPTFTLSDKAVAAGIDGTLTVSFEVDRSGNVKDVWVLAGPIWPCDSSPDGVIKEVRDAVKKNILASKFSPATKGGRPIDADATLDFAIGDAYKEAITGQSRSKSKWVVDVGNMTEQRATRLPRPSFTGYTGVAAVRVLIDERGNVISAGAVRGHPALHYTSRRAACEAAFPPTIVNGQAIKVTGLIHYDFARGTVRVR
ncbi:MAG TPA: energy transducer TonB [Pyrinomonadaceae bacterium]|nr:energy transducer TonB [Pyrinomonadaceae bacterium]